MSAYNKMGKKAIHNIENQCGFQCPSCASLVKSGVEYCPACGEFPGTMDTYDYLPSYQSREEFDEGCLASYIWFWIILSTPIAYWFSTLESPLFLLLLTPITLVIVIACLISIKRMVKYSVTKFVRTKSIRFRRVFFRIMSPYAKYTDISWFKFINRNFVLYFYTKIAIKIIIMSRV